MGVNDRSFSEILQDAVGNVQEIMRSELRLAKTEVREEAAKAKSAGGLLAAGAVFGLFAGFFLLLAIVYALSKIMPDWAASLVVAVVLAGSAGAIVSAGIKRFRQVHTKPDKTI